MGPDTTYDARRRSGIGAPWWAAVFSALLAACLVGLAMVLFLMDALATGVATVLSPDSEMNGPAASVYVEAAVLATVVVLLLGQGLVRLVARTGAATWPPALRGIGAAVVAALIGGAAMLLRLGIDPVDFLAALVQL